MTITDKNLQNATAEREKIFRRAAELAERAAHLTAAKAQRDQAQAEVDALMREDAAALTEWARAGANGKPPASDTRAREAASRKLANATEAARAVDSAIAELEAENAALARELDPANMRVKMAAAHYLVGVHKEHLAELHALEDQLEAKRAITGAVLQTAFDNFAPIASEATKSADTARLAWISRRDGEVRAVIEAEWSKIAATLPAA